MQRQTWLDGLRGIASIIVATNHIIMGQFEVPYRSFWSEPAEQNRRLIQLVPFRLLFTPNAMVTVFLVMSGYSISINPATTRWQGDLSTFYAKLTSATFRRALRLFIPVVIITIITHALLYLDLYNWYFPSSECTDLAPWIQPFQHLKCTVSDVTDLMNIVDALRAPGLNDHLITLTWEFRGSITVYLILLTTATAKPTTRFTLYACCMAFLLWYGHSDLFAFLAGLCLAEIDTRHFVRGLQPLLSTTENPKPTHILTSLPSSSTHPHKSRLSHILKYFLLTLGLYLLCTPYTPTTPPAPDYAFQYPPTSPYWHGWAVRVAAWQTYGAILVIYSLRDLPTIQKWLNNRAIQFLGRISFALYVTHMTVIRILRTPVLNLTAQVLVGKPYRGDMWAVGVAPWTYAVWSVTTVVVTVASVAVAVYMNEVIDRRPVLWARRVEEFCRVA